MRRLTNIVCRALAVVAIWAVALGADAAEVVYKIVEYNKQTAEFTLSASGVVPRNSWAYFENEYGATTGNRYNQIPRNREAVLWLEGWQGCTVRSITLSMCSNNKTGQVGVALNDGKTPLYTQKPVDFASTDWFGAWVSKDMGVYVDVQKQLDVPALTADEASIVIKGGTSEGSVYVDAITIEYDEAQGTTLESPLGWRYEKLEKKSVLNEGDEVMLYRSGSAAADIDGIEKSHYLDAVVIGSTTDVTNPEVLRFTLNKSADASLWTLTDQYGRQLGATGKGALAWDEGTTDWSIALGYDGATIASSNADYGTMRYNAPVESYARFNLYTSSSLPLPYLYRKVKQNEPVVSTALSFDAEEMPVGLDEAHIALRPTLLPKSTTDTRLLWSSSDEDVASVNGGFVTLHGVGETIITASAYDGGSTASIRPVVTESSGISAATVSNKARTRKVVEGNKVVVVTEKGRYTTDGCAAKQ